ncbi:unnamed protein product [Ilex paraguariensis]|uniref:DUF629 domain-containing protein n=1 Tax=Ilex paraguariensis TaxID=185542 RepID=A0ABC8UHC0_9AQUA
MGSKKKRNPPSPSKPPSTAKNATTSDGAPPNTISSDNLHQEQSNAEQLEYEAIHVECHRAFDALNRRNQTKALKRIADVRIRYENSSLAHHTEAVIHARIAEQTEDQYASLEHWKKALESAKKAVSLSPNSIEFALTCAILLSTLASNDQDRKEVVEECERGLSLFNFLPVIKTSRDELERIQIALKSILDKSKIGCTEAPMSVKAVEEKRKEIEARVIAARLLQQGPEMVTSDKTCELTPPIGELKEPMLDAGKISEVRSFWNSMDVEEKRACLRPKISDVKDYCAKFTGVLAAEDLLGGAIHHAENASTWKYWDCCICDHKSLNMDLLIDHLEKQHLGHLLSAKSKAFTPQKIDDQSMEVLVNGIWKPVDTAMAMEIIQNQSKDLDQNWPLSDNCERAKTLERIHSMFQLLLRHECIAASHLRKVMNCTMKMLQIDGLDQTPLCICFLGTSQLNEISNLLQDLLFEIGDFVEDELNSYPEYESKERIVICGDTLCVLLDGSLQGREFMRSTSHNAAADDGSATSFAVGDHELDVLPDCDAIAHWLHSGFTIEDQLASWPNIKKSKVRQGVEIYLILEKEISSLENMCMRKSQHLIHDKALHEIHRICIEELHKREQGVSYVPQTYESLLKKLQEELAEREDILSRSELHLIPKILQEAQAVNVNEDEAHQGDNCIRNLVQGRLRKSSKEIFNDDARILRSCADIRKLYSRLAKVSVHDYRTIIVPLLKSFIQAQLENLVYQYAIRKSDVAGEALLAELESDANKRLSKGQMKHVEGKMKDKKKKKDYRKSKDSKKQVLHEKDADQVQFSVPEDGDYPESQSVVSVIASELKQQEEELRRKFELEAEERMLEEHLERQRQIENEAKEKQLAEKNKKADGTMPEMAETLLSVTGVPTCSSGDPLKKLEETKASSLVSGGRTETKSCSHGEVKLALYTQETLEGVL